VLFGPNSAGKTSVLEAAGQLIARAEIRRADPADQMEVRAEGSVFFDLPGADVPGSADAEAYRWLLCGEHSDEGAWEWLGDGTSERIRRADLGEARTYLADLFAASGSAGTLADRILLAGGLFLAGAAFFLVDDGGVVLLVRAASLPSDTVGAATRIAAMAGDDDPLQDIAADLITHGAARIADLADSVKVRRSIVAALPPVIVLDGDRDSLSADLVNSVPGIHDRVWDLHLPRRPIPGMPGAGIVDVDNFLMDIGVRSRELYAVDPWLEGMSKDGEPLVAAPFGAYNKASWYRVRHSVLAVARMIEAEANRVAPSFVRSQGTIGIEVIPVSAWGSGPHRIRATFTEQDGRRRDLTRWCTIGVVGKLTQTRCQAAGP
jgi:hypothetical protein